MDYEAAIRWLFGLPGPGGISVHPKGNPNAYRKPPITPQMQQDSDYADGWRRSGRTAPLYQYFPNTGPKVT